MISGNGDNYSYGGVGDGSGKRPTPNPDHSYSAMLSSSMPTAARIYSIVATTSPLPSNLVEICDAITETLLYAFG